MNLFSVKNANGKIIIRYKKKEGKVISSPALFNNKRDAKIFRDLCNSEQPYCDYPCHVSKGPDHRHYTGS